jgi:hypothetical protein
MELDYELRAHGREPRFYTDARQAGAAFFTARREEQPSVVAHEPWPEGQQWLLASTARDQRDPSGYTHLLLAAPAEFVAGYEEARARLPERAVGVEDVQADAQIHSPSPTPPKGPAMTDKQPNVIESGEAREQALAREALRIDRQEIERLTFARKHVDGAPRFDVRAYGADGKVVAMKVGMTQQELKEFVGKRNAQTIESRPGNRGTVAQEDLLPKDKLDLFVEQALKAQQRNRAEEAAAAARTAQEAPQPAQATQAPAAATQAPAAPSQAPQAAPTVGPSNEAPTVDGREALRREILAELAQRFTVRTSLKGDQEYRLINDPERVVFVDRDTKLTTSSNAPDVARTMVELARAKGWDTMHLKGSPEFKAHAWVEATLRGVKVTGYDPTDHDRERLAVRLQDQQKNAIHAPQQPEGAQQAPAAPQQQTREPARAEVHREAHVQQLMDVLQLAMRDAGVPKEKRIETAAACRQRLDNMKVLPEVRVFDAQVRTQQPRTRTQEPHQQRRQQTQHRTH